MMHHAKLLAGDDIYVPADVGFEVTVPGWSWSHEGIIGGIEVWAQYMSGAREWSLEVFVIFEGNNDTRFAIADGTGPGFATTLRRLLTADETYGEGDLVPPV